jgi:hypothetical protein
LRNLLFSTILLVLSVLRPAATEAQAPLWDFELPPGQHLVEVAGQHFVFDFTQAVRVQIFDLTPIYIAGSLTLVSEPECHALIRWQEQEADILDSEVVGYRRFVWTESGHPELQEDTPDTERSPEGKGDDAEKNGSGGDDSSGADDASPEDQGNAEPDHSSGADDSTSTEAPRE